MEIFEIRSAAIDSAEKYYQYLDNNDKGLQEVTIYNITSMPEQDEGPVYKLQLSAKLFDIEAVSFKILSTGRLYNNGEIKIIEYDSDKNTILVKPDTTLTNLFRTLRSSDIRVISDMKFLVERVRKWFEEKGSSLSYPLKPSTLSDSFNKINYLKNDLPSDQQLEAIKLIFTSSFCYVWGAPGTGKTQFVLSYAVLHYIEHQKKIVIMAPTNNAIEQVLRGVLKMTDKAGVPRSKILRLGVPTRKFAEEYPEVCEERGIMKKLEELNKQIEKYQELLALVAKHDMLEKLNLSSFSGFDSLIKEQQEAVTVQEKREEEYIKANAQLLASKQRLTEANTQKSELEKKIKGIGSKLTKLFSGKQTSTEIALEKLKESLVEIISSVEYWQNNSIQKHTTLQQANKHLEDIEQRIKALVTSIQKEFSVSDELKQIVNSLNLKNNHSIRIDLEKKLKEEKLKYKPSKELLRDEYISADEIQQKLDHLQHIKSKMATASTEERLKGVNVIACTLDGYIGRFVDTNLAVDHVFMDEAGYSNMIKALPLFSLKAPVTFLGDHKQLPPVCEIKDSDIEQEPEYCNILLWAQSAIYIQKLFESPIKSLLLEYLQHKESVPNRMKMTSLKNTFRFGKSLAKILDNHVYDNGFQSSLEDGSTSIFFTHASKAEGPKSRISMNEVRKIQEIVSQLKPNDDFIILTPYKKQVSQLGHLMPQERDDLKILTVHGSQGREWDTVILSIVDTGDKWFVDSKQPKSNGLNLLNTAVSRTKKKLIIVCDYKYWKAQNGQLVADLLAVAKELKLS